MSKPKKAVKKSSPESARVEIEYAHVLRVCGPNGESINERAGDFRWPLTVGAIVSASDWRPDAECGHGLHGWLNGVGSVEGSGATERAADPASKWLVLKVVKSEIVTLDNETKCKFPRCEIAFVGTMAEAAEELVRLGSVGPIIGSTLTGGDSSTLTGGHHSTLTGGHRSTLTGGDSSTLTGGHRSTLTGGDSSTLTGGDSSTLTGGYGSTLTGGDSSTLLFAFWDEAANRTRRVLAEIGEAHCEAGVPYVCVGGKIVRKDSVSL